MASETNQPRPGPSDATDYSSTQAPETGEGRGAGAKRRAVTTRLWPGGAHGRAVSTRACRRSIATRFRPAPAARASRISGEAKT